MHGRKREKKVLSEEEQQAKAQKIAKYNRLKGAILDRNAKQIYDSVGDQVSSKLAGLNPDFYTLFNYRRGLLEHFFTQEDKDKAALCAAELQLIEQGLAKNPKSYPAWTHREWVVRQGTTDVYSELALCSKFLNFDARNFHCWNYRRAVVRMISTRACLEKELAFTREKIDQNFSNYSAWHYRSVLLPQLHQESTVGEMSAIMDAEFELVKQAFFTEPEDQSAWLYHRWLLGRVCVEGFELSGAGVSLGIEGEVERLDLKEDPTRVSSREKRVPDTPDGRARQLLVFERELATCDELLSAEPNCKWVLLTVAMLLAAIEATPAPSTTSATPAHSTTTAPSTTSTTSTTSATAAEEAGALACRASNQNRIQSIFLRLGELDPFRKAYYGDIRAQLMARLAA